MNMHTELERGEKLADVDGLVAPWRRRCGGRSRPRPLSSKRRGVAQRQRAMALPAAVSMACRVSYAARAQSSSQSSDG